MLTNAFGASGELTQLWYVRGRGRGIYPGDEVFQVLAIAIEAKLGESGKGSARRWKWWDSECRDRQGQKPM